MQSSQPLCQKPGNLPAYLLPDFMHSSKSPSQRECPRTIHSNELKKPPRLLGFENTRTASEDSACPQDHSTFIEGWLTSSYALFLNEFQCYGVLVYTDMYMAGVLYWMGSPWTRNR